MSSTERLVTLSQPSIISPFFPQTALASDVDAHKSHEVGIEAQHLAEP